MGRYEEAIPHLRILTDKDKGDFLPALYLGYAYLKCNSHEECESCLYKLIRSLRSMAIFRFSWDKIPGKDNGKLKDFLKRKYTIDWGINPNIEKEDDRITIKIPGKEYLISLQINDEKTEVTCKIDEKEIGKLIAKTENCELNIYEKSDNDKEDKAITDKFYGQQYDDQRHINEILARAYIYLAYSYVERDANPCDSWEMAFEARDYVENLREKHGLEEERARDGVLPEKSDKSCTDSGYGFLSVSALDISDQSLSVAKELAQSYSIDGKQIKIIFDRKDG